MLSKRNPKGKASKSPSKEDPLNNLKTELAADLTWADFFIGLAIAIILSTLLLNYKYQPIPAFKLGDVSNVEIKAPRDIIVEDKWATQAEKNEALKKVASVFDYDPNVLASLERKLRDAFSAGRSLSRGAESDANRRQKGSKKPGPNREKELISDLRSILGDFYSDDLGASFYKRRFSRELEEQLIAVLRSAMSPAVVSSREQLLDTQGAGIKLRNIISGKEESLQDPSSIKDMAQARAEIRRNRFKLSTLDPESRKEADHFLEALVTPNLVFNSSETQKRKQEVASNVPLILREIKQGKVVVREGDRITDVMLLELNNLKSLQQLNRISLKFIGSLLLSIMFMYFIWHYLAHHKLRDYKIRSHFLLISLVLFLSLITTRLFILVADLIYEKFSFQSGSDPVNFYYAVPLAFGGILITLLVDVNTALLFSLLFSMLVGIFTSDVNLACYAVISNFVAIYGIKHYKERLVILKAGLMIGIVNVFTVIGLDFLTRVEASTGMIGVKAICSLNNGIVSSMFASLLLPVLESVFKITTDIKLLELSNLNNSILRRMSVEAPGTYHHSLVMGTLGETAAESIGANSLLVRVGAYYHDIGKLKMPDYFVENQVFSQNKHDKLSPSMSSLIISSHVRDGLDMAKEIGLMPGISDMIPQHHGTRLMTYFYEKAKSTSKDEELNEADFRYPGPKPQTKEAAIIMIADSVEATSRTLVDPTPAQIQGMIRRIIDSIVADGQLEECDLTIKDLNLIEQSMLLVLTGIFHHRIEYPGYEFSKPKEEVAKQSHQ